MAHTVGVFVKDAEKLVTEEFRRLQLLDMKPPRRSRLRQDNLAGTIKRDFDALVKASSAESFPAAPRVTYRNLKAVPILMLCSVKFISALVTRRARYGVSCLAYRD
jgi:hypothetical protein